MKYTMMKMINSAGVVLMVLFLSGTVLAGSGRPDDTAGGPNQDTSEVKKDTADTMDSNIQVDTADTAEMDTADTADSDVQMDTADTMDSDVQMDTTDTLDSDTKVDTSDTVDSDVEMDTSKEWDSEGGWDSEQDGWDSDMEKNPNLNQNGEVHMIQQGFGSSLVVRVAYGTESSKRKDGGQSWDSDVEVDTADTADTVDSDVQMDTTGTWDSDVEVDTADTVDSDVQMDTTDTWDSDVGIDTADTGDADVQMDTTDTWDSDVEVDTADTAGSDVQMDTTDTWDSDVEVDTADTGDADIEMDTTEKSDTEVSTVWQFNQWDANQNGSIGQSEFVDGWTQAEVVSEIDTNANDTISGDELAAVLFTLWDTDTNGMIDSTEFKAAHRWYADSMDVGQLSYWDTNGDMMLNKNEVAGSLDLSLLKGVEEQNVENGLPVDQFNMVVFQVADRDGNEQIDREEWTSFVSGWDRVLYDGLQEEVVKGSHATWRTRK